MKHVISLISVLLTSLMISGCAQYVALEAGMAVAKAVADEMERPVDSNNKVSKVPQRATDSTNFSELSNNALCRRATLSGKWDMREGYKEFVAEAKRRRLKCELLISYETMNPAQLCGKLSDYETRNSAKTVIKDRNISCDTASMLEARVELGDRDAMIKLGGYRIRGTGTLGYRDVSGGVALIARGNRTVPDNILVTCRSAIKQTNGSWEWIAGHDGSRVRDQFGLLIDDCLAIIKGHEARPKTRLAEVTPETSADDLSSVGLSKLKNMSVDVLCKYVSGEWVRSSFSRQQATDFALRNNISCGVDVVGSGVQPNQSSTTSHSGITTRSDAEICGILKDFPSQRVWKEEARRRGLTCGVSPILASVDEKRGNDDLKLERQMRQELEARLAKLEAERDSQQQAISQDTQPPLIRISPADADHVKAIISGVATDNSGIAEVRIDGEIVSIDGSGSFIANVFIPVDGKTVEIVAIDLKGLSTTETIRLERIKRTQQVSRLAAVNPLVGPKQKLSRDRAALIIGLEKYAVAQPAQFASRDAQMFADYAREKLGIPAGNVKVLTDSGASEREILTALKVWLPQAVKPDTTDLYVFYAGHGMPTADGSSAYLVPYDGDVRLLEDTAISRKRFFDEIGAAKPRSATFFFDNCYSGATRSEELLLASRPLGIKVQETDVPDNYLVFTAGESNQTAGVLDEVKHGRFSYFVFKGLEGEADANSDGRISAGELHAYVRESVGRFSAGAQTPTMLGDGSRWVVK